MNNWVTVHSEWPKNSTKHSRAINKCILIQNMTLPYYYYRWVTLSEHFFSVEQGQVRFLSGQVDMCLTDYNEQDSVSVKGFCAHFRLQSLKNTCALQWFVCCTFCATSYRPYERVHRTLAFKLKSLSKTSCTSLTSTLLSLLVPQKAQFESVYKDPGIRFISQLRTNTVWKTSFLKCSHQPRISLFELPAIPCWSHFESE